MEKKYMTTAAVKSVVDTLKDWYNENKGYFDDESDFYCGITNDPETRKSQHENQDHDGRTITRMIAIECKDKDRVADVETKMEDEGFDIGNPPHETNGAAEDSKWVYLYKKPKIVFRPKK